MNACSPRPGPQGLVAYLAALVGQAPAGQLIELRYRRSSGGMGQRFFDVERPAAAAAAITVLGRATDVYIGVAPRVRREGTRAAVAGGWAPRGQLSVLQVVDSTWHAIVIAKDQPWVGTAPVFAGATPRGAAESALWHFRDRGRPG